MKRPIGQIKNPIPSGLSLHPIAFSSNNATGIKVFKSRITLNGNQANSCRINCTQLQNLSIVFRIIIVIWWLDIFQHLHERKFAQWHTQNAKVVPKFYQIVNKPPKNRPRLWRFCQSGEISPNLVTLIKWYFLVLDDQGTPDALGSQIDSRSWRLETIFGRFHFRKFGRERSRADQKVHSFTHLESHLSRYLSNSVK